MHGARKVVMQMESSRRCPGSLKYLKGRVDGGLYVDGVVDDDS
jgi:hypothetical protein